MELKKIEPIKSVASYKLATFTVSVIESRTEPDILEFYLSEERMAFVLFMFGIAKDVLEESGQTIENLIMNNASKSIDYYIAKFGGAILKNPFNEVV